MAKAKNTAFFCSECGYESAKWFGQCPACKAWNTFVEEPIASKLSAKGISAVRKESTYKDNHPVSLKEINSEEKERTSTGIGELDRVLGGGIVQGSLVLVPQRCKCPHPRRTATVRSSRPACHPATRPHTTRFYPSARLPTHFCSMLPLNRTPPALLLPSQMFAEAVQTQACPFCFPCPFLHSFGDPGFHQLTMRLVCFHPFALCLGHAQIFRCKIVRAYRFACCRQALS